MQIPEGETVKMFALLASKLLGPREVPENALRLAPVAPGRRVRVSTLNGVMESVIQYGK